MGFAGGCQCGAIRYSAAGEAAHHALCHCADCRKSSGAPMVGWIAFAEDALAVEGAPVVYESSPGVTRTFCGTCGTGLFYRNPAMLPGIVDVQSATLDDAAAQAPGIEIMVAERLPWLDQVGQLRRFERYPGMD